MKTIRSARPHPARSLPRRRTLALAAGAAALVVAVAVIAATSLGGASHPAPVSRPGNRALRGALLPQTAARLGLAAKGPKPYPLDVPLARRSASQLAEGRVMYAAAMDVIGRVPPLPPSLAGKVPTSSEVAQVRLASAVPTLTWTAYNSFAPDVVAVRSAGPGISDVEMASYAGGTCWLLRLAHGRASFGATPATTSSCRASLAPSTGWRSSWPKNRPSAHPASGGAS